MVRSAAELNARITRLPQAPSAANAFASLFGRCRIGREANPWFPNHP